MSEDPRAPVCEPGEWYQVRTATRPILGSRTVVARGHLPGRNHPCPCGSGKKYKHCQCKAVVEGR